MREGNEQARRELGDVEINRSRHITYTEGERDRESERTMPWKREKVKRKKGLYALCSW